MSHVLGLMIILQSIPPGSVLLKLAMKWPTQEQILELPWGEEGCSQRRPNHFQVNEWTMEIDWYQRVVILLFAYCDLLLLIFLYGFTTSHLNCWVLQIFTSCLACHFVLWWCFMVLLVIFIFQLHFKVCYMCVDLLCTCLLRLEPS